MADKEMTPAGDGLFWRGAEKRSLPTVGIEADIIEKNISATAQS
jgi:hypothetical protein